MNEKDNEKRVFEEEEEECDSRVLIVRLICGAVIFVAGLATKFLLKTTEPVQLALMVIAYLVLGYDVLWRALKNIVRGRIFDEQFLMSLSTLGAFAIQEYPEAVAVMLFYQFGEFLQDLSVDRSKDSITELLDIRPDSAALYKNGDVTVVTPNAVEVGDLIIVKPGERIPLDGIISEGEAMLDTKALTGEAVPRHVKAGDEIISGCINTSGVLKIKVTKTFGESTVSQIVNLVENAADRKAPTENFITAFARYYTPIVVVMALCLALLPPLFLNGEWKEWLSRALVFLVISCPCALVISIPLTFFGGIGAASKHGILVKGGNYLDALNKVDTVVFDKTGTLTKGVFKVTSIIPSDGFSSDEVLQYAASAERMSNHPIAKSITEACDKLPDINASVTEFKEISGRGISAKIGEHNVLVGNGMLLKDCGVTFVTCEKIGTKVYVAIDNKYAGCVVISDEIKDDSRRAVEALKNFGVKKTIMLTGDDETIGKAVADEIGLDEYHAGLLPHQKVEKIEAIDVAKDSGSKLVFVGDGINDAPVLARADIGIAMGALGSDAAIEAADIVLMTDEPSKIVEAIKISKATRRIVFENIIFALAVKIVFLVLGALGIAGMWIAVFGDVGVALIAVFNAMRIMKK